MADTFKTLAVGIAGPADQAASVTPNDSADLSTVARGIYVGVSGDLKVDLVGGGTVTFVGLASGVIHPIRVSRVHATGTTATSILAVW